MVAKSDETDHEAYLGASHRVSAVVAPELMGGRNYGRAGKCGDRVKPGRMSYDTMVGGTIRAGHGEAHALHPSGYTQHAGNHVGMFRRRFWWSLLLTVPLVVTSHMVMDWFGHDLEFYGMGWVGPVLGTVVFASGG